MSQRNSARSRALAILTFAAVATILAGAARAVAQDPKPLSDSASVTVKATIEAIDKTDRRLTLKGPEGNSVIVQAGENVKRFDQLKVGDEVTATYTESIAVRVRKPGDPVPAQVKNSVKSRASGKPGVTVTAERTLSVTIQEIDRTAPSVTVKGPEGRVHSFRVEDVKNIEGLKVGDTVDITFTVAALLKADTPAATP